MAQGSGNTPNIDLDALTKEVNSMSEEDIKKQLLVRLTRQKKQQAKMQGSASQKAYQAKQKELRRLLKERAKSMGIYDQLNAQAAEAAQAELSDETPEAADEIETTA